MNNLLDALGKPLIPDVARYRALFRFPLRSFYADVGIADAHHASKRDVIASWLDGSGLAPREVLLIGDTNQDLEIAGDLGTRFVHFTGGHQDLSDQPDLARIATLSQVAKHLGRP